MTGLFRNNLFVNAMFLLPYALVLSASYFLNPSTYVIDKQDSIVTSMIFSYVTSPYVQGILAAVLLFVHASIINRMVIRNRMTHELSHFPGMFYILFCCFFPSLLGLSDFLIANTFVLLALYEIAKFYQKNHLISQVFMSGVYFGMAAIVVPEYLPYTLLGLFSVIYFNALNTRNVLQYISGVICVMLTYYEVLFLLDFDVFHELGLYGMRINNVFSGRVIFRPEIWLMMVTIVLSIFHINGYLKKKSIAAHKKIMLLYYFLVGGFLLALSSRDPDIRILYVMYIPLGIFAAMSFLRIKNHLLAGILHIFLLILLALFHFDIVPLSTSI